MKRRVFIKYLTEKGCVLAREGGKYSVFQNPATGQEASVTRHTEIADFAAKKICRELGIDQPDK